MTTQNDNLGAAVATAQGILDLSHGGTGSSLSATGGLSFVLMQASVGAALTVRQLSSADLSDMNNVVFFSGGNVGVGAAAAYSLDLQKHGVQTIRSKSTDNSASFVVDAFSTSFSSSMNFRQGGADKYIVGLRVYDTGTDLQIGNGSTKLLSIDTTGNAVAAGTIKERNRATPMGEWIAFTPTVTPSAGTWTATTYTTAKYTLIGKTMVLAVVMAGTTSLATRLDVTIPGGFTCSTVTPVVARVSTNGGGSYTTGLALANSVSNTVISVYSDLNGSNFPAAATQQQFTITIPLD